MIESIMKEYISKEFSGLQYVKHIDMSIEFYMPGDDKYSHKPKILFVPDGRN